MKNLERESLASQNLKNTWSKTLKVFSYDFVIESSGSGYPLSRSSNNEDAGIRENMCMKNM